MSDLEDSLEAEYAATQQGTPACGAVRFEEAGGPTCMRAGTHAEDGERARESHAFRMDYDGGGHFWVTWVEPAVVPL